MHKYMTCEMQDGSVWAVPVDVITRNRAEHYAKEFDSDVERSLAEDTVPFFENDYDIEGWAVSNMNWSDFDGVQVKISSPKESGPSEEWWVNGSKGFLDELPTRQIDDKVLLAGYSKVQASSAFVWLQNFAEKEDAPIEASLALIFWHAAITAYIENASKP